MITLDHPAIWNCTNDEYHAEREHESSTTLGCFIASRPLYHGIYVAGTIPRPAPTPATLLGSALHVKLLEPDLWPELVAVAPEVDRRTKDGKAEWQAFLDGAAGKITITLEQAVVIERMVEGAMANPMARELIEAEGKNELSLLWELDGVKVKTRLDRCLAAGMIADLKSSSDPSPEAFSRSAYNFGYHRQAWLYRQSAVQILDVRYPEFLHIVCGSEPPYECHVYELDDDALRFGESQVRKALAELRECRETGDWSSPLSGKINRLGLPRWAYMNGAING